MMFCILKCSFEILFIRMICFKMAAFQLKSNFRKYLLVLVPKYVRYDIFLDKAFCVVVYQCFISNVRNVMYTGAWGIFKHSTFKCLSTTF